MNKRPIYIIGFPCCGKTTAGKLLSERLRREFIDLDDEICKEYGFDCACDFVKSYGESFFRIAERMMLSNFSNRENVVVVCRSDASCDNSNMSIIKGSGTSIYLQQRPDILFARLRDNKHKIPLVSAMGDNELMNWIIATYPKKAQCYERADIIIKNWEISLKNIV